MKNLMLRGIVVGPVMTNCYFLKNKATEEILIVDPAAEAERICRTLDRIGGKPAGILLTHGHYDHIMAVNELKENLGLPVYAAREEKAMLNDASSNLSLSWEGKGSRCRSLSGRRGSSGTCRIYSEDVSYTRSYGRILLLLSGRGRSAYEWRYHFCRKLWKM